MVLTIITVVFVYYSYKTHRVFYTKHSEGHHKYASLHTYTDIVTGRTMAYNNTWNAAGVERFFGFIGWGVMNFTNSYRLPARFKYMSILIRLPMGFEVGVDIGLVAGYNRYKQGFKIGDRLLAVCPRIRWVDPSDQNSFISYRQFGSASVTTRGWTNYRPIL